MHSRLRSFILVAALGVAAFPTRAQIIVVPIGATTVSSGHPLDIISPNVFDPFHPKELKFTADIQPLSVPPVAPLLLTFDWIDLGGGVVVTAPIDLTPFVGGGSFTIPWTIPFCPQQVSLHLETQDPQGYLVVGVFTHECLIPEPAEYATIGALGLVGLGAVRRFRHGHRA